MTSEFESGPSAELEKGIRRLMKKWRGHFEITTHVGVKPIVKSLESDDAYDVITISMSGGKARIKVHHARNMKAVDQVAISVVYLNTVLRQDLVLCVFLTISAIAFAVIRLFVVALGGFLPVISVFVPIAVMVLVLLRSQILKYRIVNGLYGTNECEARQIIGYIVRNADRIDFGGGDGKLRKALLPEAKSEVVPSPTSGVGART